MDDSCVVCVEALECVAYGACGHKEVCSTCVARLRFICEDRRCCIYKSKSDVIFVTKVKFPFLLSLLLLSFLFIYLFIFYGKDWVEFGYIVFGLNGLNGFLVKTQ